MGACVRAHSGRADLVANGRCELGEWKELWEASATSSCVFTYCPYPLFSSIVILYLRFGAQVLQDNFVAELSTHYQNYILSMGGGRRPSGTRSAWSGWRVRSANVKKRRAPALWCPVCCGPATALPCPPLPSPAAAQAQQGQAVPRDSRSPAALPATLLSCPPAGDSLGTQAPSRASPQSRCPLLPAEH